MMRRRSTFKSLSSWLAQKANDWPLAFVYLGLLAVGLGWMGVWLLHESGRVGGAWLDIWAPHGASVAFELFLATVVVGGILRRHEMTELQPLRDAALLRLQLILASFIRSIAVQYAFFAPDQSLPLERSDLIARWLGLLPTSHQAWLPQWFTELDRLCTALESVRDRYEHELDPRTVALIDAFLHQWREDEGLRLRSTYELAKSLARTFDVPEPDGKVLNSHQVMSIEAIISHAATIFERYEEISGRRLEIDARAHEQFRLAQVARHAVVQSTTSGPGASHSSTS